MSIFLLITILIVFIGMKPAKNGELHKTYISVNQTTAINGLFTIFVFFTHACNYITLGGINDLHYSRFRSYILQTVVVTFFFYSGYGIMESIKKKGIDYVKQIPKNRFLKVLLHFDIAVLLYLILNTALGISFPLKNTLLAFTGYKSIGNSDWYIFAVLGLYLIVFISFMLARKNKLLGVILTTALTLGFVYLQIRLKRPGYCYNTIILFPVGMMYSMVHEYIEKLFSKHEVFYYTAFALAFAVYSLVFPKRGSGIEFYSMWGIMFMALIVLATMKVQIGNGILDFFGSHVFSIYILQRLPMKLLDRLGLADSNKYVFVVLCLFITVALAVIFDLAMDKLDKAIFTRKKKAIAE